MKYPVVVRQTEEGFSAHCIALPGCWSQGETEEEAIANIRSAIEEYLSVRAELVLESGTTGHTVEVTV